MNMKKQEKLKLSNDKLKIKNIKFNSNNNLILGFRIMKKV